MDTAAFKSAFFKAAQGLARDLGKDALGNVVSQAFESCGVQGCANHALAVCSACSKHGCLDHVFLGADLPPRVVCVPCIVVDYRAFRAESKARGGGQ